MAWNEPGNRDRDPWGGRRPSGPPSPGDVLQRVLDQLGKLFGGDARSNGLALLGVLVLGWGLLGFYQVNEQERAVVLRLGVFHEIVGPGLKWNPPLIDSVTLVNTTRLRSHSAKGLMLTRNVNLVQVELSVQYNIDDPRRFVLSVKDPERSLREATDSAVRNVVGNTLLDQVLTEGRAQVAVEVQHRLQDYLDAYKTGIRVTKVNIEGTNAPDPVQDAFKDVNKAREDEERFKNEAEAYANMVVPESRGQAQRILEDAAAYKDQVVVRAQGDASRFTQLLAEYRKAPAVTRQRLYTDAVQEVLVKNPKVLLNGTSGNSMFYLPLDKLGSPAAGNAATAETRLDADQLRQLGDQVMEKMRAENPPSRKEGGR